MVILSISYVHAQQEKEKLQQKKSKIEEEINYTNKLLPLNRGEACVANIFATAFAYQSRYLLL